MIFKASSRLNRGGIQARPTAAAPVWHPGAKVVLGTQCHFRQAWFYLGI